MALASRASGCNHTPVYTLPSSLATGAIIVGKLLGIASDRVGNSATRMPFGMPTTTKYFLPAADASRQTWRWDHLGHARSHGGAAGRAIGISDRRGMWTGREWEVGRRSPPSSALALDKARDYRSTTRRQTYCAAPVVTTARSWPGRLVGILKTPKRPVVKTPILDRIRRTALWLNAEGRTEWLRCSDSRRDVGVGLSYFRVPADVFGAAPVYRSDPLLAVLPAIAL